MKVINHLTFSVAVSGKNVSKIKYVSIPTLLV